jgi:uncharacterized protein YkwD
MVNQIRSVSRHCGQVRVAEAPPLAWEGRLALSAERYAAELSRRDAVSHRGQVAASLRQRLAAVDYGLARAGENLASGPQTLAEALQLWLASPEHCANLMEPAFIHLGLACAENAASERAYWVMHLAVPVRSNPDR